MLAWSPHPASDVRGQGARRTQARWHKLHSIGDAVIAAGDFDRRWQEAVQAGARTVGDIDDAALLCRVEALEMLWDPDGSPPELRVRIAWGFDADVVGYTFFDAPEGQRRDVALRHVSLRNGELLKISLVDVDAFSDGWGGMAIARYRGTSPMTFTHRAFRAECYLAR